MMGELSPHVFEQGFETTLESLITYAELQATLYQAHGDLDKWEYWVKSWICLECAASQISGDYPLDNWQTIWHEYRLNQSPPISL